MNWRAAQYYYDPYRESKPRNQYSPSYQNRDQRSYSNERKIGHIIITFNSKDKKRIFQNRSPPRETKTSPQKPKLYLISNDYFIHKKENPQDSSHRNQQIQKPQVIPQASKSIYKKSPIRILKKTPVKIEPPMIKTIVSGPSSISSSVLGNFQSNPDRLLGNMTESTLSKIFKS